MAARVSYHVIRNPDGGWSIIKAGASRASGNFRTQRDAIREGRQISRHQSSDLYIHGRDGRVRSKDSYVDHCCVSQG